MTKLVTLNINGFNYIKTIHELAELFIHNNLDKKQNKIIKKVLENYNFDWTKHLSLVKYCRINLNRIKQIQNDKNMYLGSGKFAKVYKYTDKTALKVVEHRKYDEISEKVTARCEVDVLIYIRDNLLIFNKPVGVIWLYDYLKDKKQDYLLIELMNTDFWHFLDQKHSEKDIKAILLQIVFTMTFLQATVPAFKHNDLKADNILLKPLKNNLELAIGNFKWSIPTGFQHAKISDFDYANISGICDNIKVDTKFSKSFGATSDPNNIYDLHIFFNSLYSRRKSLPKGVIDFIESIIPQHLRNDNKHLKYGRLRKPNNHIGSIPKPCELLLNPYFSEFRI